MEDNAGLSASVATLERPAAKVQDGAALYIAGCHFQRGRIALYAILKALGIGSGDEVIIQAFTCVAVPCPVLATGARPVYADIDGTFNLDPSSVEARLTSRTRAIVVQHTFGIPANMDRLLRIANARGIYVIEDCCHTVASSYRGTMVGHFGDGAFSAYRWGKPLVLGIGGTAVIHAEEPLKRLQQIHKSGCMPGQLQTARIRLEHLLHQALLRPSTFWLLRDGYRCLIKTRVVIPTFPKVELQGELSDVDKLMPSFHQQRLAERITSAFEEDVEFRRRRASQYARALQDMGWRTCQLDQRYDPVYLRYPFLASDKDKILREARKQRVEFGDWFVSAVHPHSNSESEELGYRQGMCPVAERTAKEILTLPIYHRVRDRDVERSIDFLQTLHHQGLR